MPDVVELNLPYHMYNNDLQEYAITLFKFNAAWANVPMYIVFVSLLIHALFKTIYTRREKTQSGSKCIILSCIVNNPGSVMHMRITCNLWPTHWTFLVPMNIHYSQYAKQRLSNFWEDHLLKTCNWLQRLAYKQQCDWWDFLHKSGKESIGIV